MQVALQYNMYYNLITFACFVKAMEEGRELANTCVFQNLSVFYYDIFPKKPEADTRL